MFEASTSSIPKENQLSRRNDSFSTVSSSLAAADIMQQYSNLAQNYNKNKEAKKFTELPNNPTKVEFENSDGIHVGDVVYHIHHHSPEDGTLGVVRKLRHARNDFFNHPPPLVTNLLRKEKFCFWTVTNLQTLFANDPVLHL